MFPPFSRKSDHLGSILPAMKGVGNGDGVWGADIVPETGTIDSDSWGWDEREKTPVGCDDIVCGLSGES